MTPAFAGIETHRSSRQEPDWCHGAFCIEDREIVDNDDAYLFEVCARELLVEGDRSYEAGVVVDKCDGRIGTRPSVPGRDRSD